MVAGDLSHLFEPSLLDIIHSGSEVFDDVARHLPQLLLRSLAQLYPINHIAPIIHLSGEYVYQGATGKRRNCEWVFLIAGNAAIHSTSTRSIDHRQTLFPQ
jgi:hypothetical protein